MKAKMQLKSSRVRTDLRGRQHLEIRERRGFSKEELEEISNQVREKPGEWVVLKSNEESA